MSEWLAAPPDGVDLDRANAARVYDYYLGGNHNFAADRELAEQAIALWPDLPLIMQANRAFLRRAVEFCATEGIRQFLDLGSGIPTVGNVHEVAQAVAPDSRVVYVDNESVAVASSRSMLRGNPRAATAWADLRDPEAVLGSPEVAALLDLSRPVALLMVAVLHFVLDDDHPASIVARYRDALAPGSYLVVSHATSEGRPDMVESHEELYRRRTSTPLTMRSRAQVTAFFAGFDLVDPGVVLLPQWRPDSSEDTGGPPERFSGLAGVGRKPAR
ncbi:SAM-dependent methyltransferase [Saccharopolyspora rosea]|uniref:SAM-dependent methyltransferase n=1 Tax=Saccharopolyspora rosea TaxID=524884 RepID=A0ABW3FTX0_9PSEU|nr:SAM-dependent methyltransferase [Saccharopolyspora rosea]